MTLATSLDAKAMAGEKKWEAIRADLRAAHGEEIFASWFDKIRFEAVSGSVIQLSTPTAFIRHWTQNNYGAEILARWRAVEPDATELSFIVRGAMRPATPPRDTLPPGGVGEVAPARRKAPDLPVVPSPGGAVLEGSPLEPRYTFDTMVEGPANALAVAAAHRVATARPGERIAYNPLFVAAPVGLGKTHLLQAIAAEAAASATPRRVLYLTAEHFMYRFVSAIRNKTTIGFKDLVRDIDILLVDDLQFLNGVKVHEEFCHTMTALVDGGKQVVIAADRAPADLEGLEPRVRSRLGGGLLVELEPPTFDMRRKIVVQRIEAQAEAFEGLDFPGEVADFVAQSVATNGRDLDGAVNRLVAHNQLTNAPITIKMAETILRDLTKAREARRPKIEDIQRVVSQHFSVSRQDLVSARRTRVIVRPRQIAMYLSKTQTPRSLPEIGRRFGNRDHTTVLHAVRKIEELLATDKQLAEDIETLKRLLDQ